MLSREQQEMIREVFKYKFDEIDKAISELADCDEINAKYKQLMKEPLLSKKGEYHALQNFIINKLSDM